MPKPVFASYCQFALQADEDSVHRHYHNHEYGYPLTSDNELFARMVLEINQAGLSWDTILKKKANFYSAYDQFNIHTVARYGNEDRNRLLNDPGIIRNKLKVAAAIENARRIESIQEVSGSFQNWLNAHHPKTREEWTALFKKQFKFMGGEIVNEFLMSTGYLPGAHIETCPFYKVTLKAKPAWSVKTTSKKIKAANQPVG
jgi:DNA-3-methyladenine glycosylase I